MSIALETHLLPESSFQNSIRIHSDPAGTDPQAASSPCPSTHAPHQISPIRTLSPIPSQAMNTLNGGRSPSPELNRSTNGTIRSVPSDSLHIGYPSDEAPRQYPPKSESHGMTSSKTTPAISGSKPPLTRHNNSNLAIGNGLVRKISSEFGPTRSYTANNLYIPDDNAVAINGTASGSPSQDSGGGGEWNSAVGHANTSGKSGRVINKLMSDNDALKRDIKLERLRGEEAKQAVRMVEQKLENVTKEFERQAHDTAVESLLKKRRERQFEEMKAQIDGERLRADRAVEKERSWREQMEQIQKDCANRIAEADERATRKEAEYNALAAGWNARNRDYEMGMAKMEKLAFEGQQQKREDAVKLNKLELISQQKQQEIDKLHAESRAKDELLETFKKGMDKLAQPIKDQSSDQLARNEAYVEASQETLHMLKWALGVHNARAEKGSIKEVLSQNPKSWTASSQGGPIPNSNGSGDSSREGL